jgi:Skp family chaperone for outer membrane proteins
MPKLPHRFAAAALGLAILGASLVSACSRDASTPDLKIIVIDQQAVFRDSLAGRDIARQGAILRDQILAEVQAEQKAIVDAQKDLAGNSGVYSPAQREQKIKALTARQNAYPMFEQRKNQILQASLTRASTQVENAFRPIVQKLIEENKATLVLDKAQVMYTAPALDMTKEAIGQLDGVIKTVKVERVNLDTAPGQPVVPVPAAQSKNQTPGPSAN